MPPLKTDHVITPNLCQMTSLAKPLKFCDRTIFFANNSELNQTTREEQEVATTCKALIQNAIVLWNYLYLSQLLTNCADDNERCEMVSMIKNCSVIVWRHINLHGEYDFKRQAANDALFDMDKILALQIA